MRAHDVDVEVIRAIDHDIATGVYPDMTEHGWRLAGRGGAGSLENPEYRS
jgi:hypothetical protein